LISITIIANNGYDNQPYNAIFLLNSPPVIDPLFTNKLYSLYFLSNKIISFPIVNIYSFS